MWVERVFRLKYSKIVALAIIILFSYFFFSRPAVVQALGMVGEFSYIGIFFSGIIFTFGFTMPIAIGLFVMLEPSNIYIASIIGGFGALVSDLFIFHMIRTSFLKEFHDVQKSSLYKFAEKVYKKTTPKLLRTYLLFLFAGFVIASPLPDEIGISLLAGFTKIRKDILAIFSFILNTLGIYIILALSH